MYGRSWFGLLAAGFVSVSLMLGQSPEGRKDKPPSGLRSSEQAATSLLSAEPGANTRTNTSQAQGAIALAPVLPRHPGPPVRPVPIPEPLPWRPPVLSPLSGLAQLARAAGIIFSGTVISVARTSATVPGQAVGSVAITFHVENAIRGATANENLTITQWIGLWSSGQRYQPGERLLLFLYPRSRIGLTSCVGATMGRFAVDSSGDVWLSPQQILAFRTDPVLGGKSRLRLSDFASAVRWAGEEE
jgi:hypothetical protein